MAQGNRATDKALQTEGKVNDVADIILIDVTTEEDRAAGKRRYRLANGNEIVTDAE